MTPQYEAPSATVMALVLYRPRLDEWYDLDTTAALSGVSRRAILKYCRCGLVIPSFEIPYGAMMFGPEAVLTVRGVERVRIARGLERAWIAAMCEVLEDLELLRAEARRRRNE
ncbi:MAG: hypothetical protein IPJ04_16100 [Candidatus Eisenbacteria bacterium]|nr:hypothetical protein [Candidatus Eisenbacteria bacterium]